MIVTVCDFSKKSETEQLSNPAGSRGRFVSVFLLQSRRLLGYVPKRFSDSTVELNSSLHPLKENQMADLFRLSASEAAARIREGKLTSEALVRSCLERIDARESQVKAWVHLDRDFALAQARECDRSAHPRTGC